METFRSRYNPKQFLLKNNAGWIMVSNTGPIYTITLAPYTAGEVSSIFEPCSLQDFLDFLDRATCILTQICENNGAPKKGFGISTLIQQAQKNQA